METDTSHESRTLTLIPVAAVLGASIGLIAAGFIWLVVHLKDIVWPEHGYSDNRILIVAVCVAGGFLVGIMNILTERHRKAAYDLNEAFAEATGTDVSVPPSTRIIASRTALGITSLGFGAPLGPEAPLIALATHLSSRLARVLRISREQAVNISLAGALGALFAAPLVAIAVEGEVAKVKPSVVERAKSMGPEIIAAVVAFVVFLKLLPESNNHPFEAPGSVDPGIGIDLLWCAIAALLASGVGRMTDFLIPLARRFAIERIPGGAISIGVASGAVLGAGALVTPVILYSGHHETQVLLDGGHTTAQLIGLSLLKVVMVVVCLAGGWFGGQIFPLAFSGAAIALAFGQIVDSPATLALAASGYVAACVVNLRKPILVLVIFMFLFPASTWLSMAISMAIASLVMSKEVKADH